MKVQKIGSRGYLFIFPDFNPFPQVSMSIQIYVINGKTHLFVCDTGLGIEQMNGIRQYLKKENLDRKPIIVFNSHFHLDHIGGNGAFEGAKIISHILCREKMIKSIEDITEEDKKFLEGTSIAYPSIVFKERMIFPEDDVEFFYSPGHSEDSTSCYDQIDKVLFVGDNLIDPIPLLTWHRMDKYLETLQNYCDIETEVIILGHNLVLNDISFIKETMSYIKKFQAFKVDITNFTPNHATWYRRSLIYVGIDLKETGKEKEALKYFKYVRDLIQQPKLKPLSEEERNEFEEFLRKELNNK